ncbi:MAG: hypothetical protein VKO64_02670 [Candidatus Sericytochromatia bacterium]|nr:hypothetical protein [Candidatus Sericytochromatia bacterium]
MKKSLLTGVLLLGLAGCGQAAPGITGQPAASSPDLPAVTTLAELPVSERIAALARIPTMRTQRLNAIFDALALRHPEDAEALNQVRSRMLALDETGIKALRAALWQDMKDRSVEEVHLEFLAMIDKPSRLVSLLDAKLDALDTLDEKGIKALGATLPSEMDRLETFQAEVVRAFVTRIVRRLGQMPAVTKG